MQRLHLSTKNISTFSLLLAISGTMSPETPDDARNGTIMLSTLSRAGH